MRTLGVVVVGACVLSLVACGAQQNKSGTVTDVVAPVGIYVNGPLLVSPDADPKDSPAMAVSGTLSYDGKCLLLNDSPIIWAHASTWNAELQQVETPAGDHFELGVQIERGGASLTWATTDRSLFTGEAVELIEACIGESGEVIDFR